MDPVLVGIIGFACVLVLMAIGSPVGISFLVVGFVGLIVLAGYPAAMASVARVPYYWGTEYIFSCIPLFVLMGFVVSKSGIAGDLFDCTYKWFGALPGGLAHATVVGCAGFAALSGSSTAGAATMSSVCYPEMERYGYDKRLATGSIAAGGTMSIMIPPSLGFIVYGFLTEESIGKLFIAGILPGIISLLSFLAVIYVWVKLKPSVAPLSTKSFPLSEKMRSLKSVWPVIAIFALVIGGIYLGLFTPVEAAGAGAAAVIVLTFAMKKLTIRGLIDCALQSTRVTAMIFLLIMGAMVFNLFLAMSQLPQLLSSVLGGIGSPNMALALILLAYFPLGMFMDATAMFVLTVPLYLPCLVEFNINLIWFGVLAVHCAEMGLITPPVGMNVYVVQGVVNRKEVSVGDVFRGIFPFFYADIVILLLIAFIPAIATYLPSIMM